MILKSNQLIGLSVKDKSGRILGKIKDFELETDTNQITAYVVSPSKLVEKFLANDLVIAQSQVIEITAEEMIVDNGIVGNRAVSERAPVN